MASMFDNMDETVQVKRVNKPGIYRNVRYDGLKYTPAQTKKSDKGETKTISPYAELLFTIFEDTENGKTKVVTERILSKFIFAPPVTEADIKFFNKKYDKRGVEIGTNSPSEQIVEMWNETARTFVQLAQALGSTFDVMKQKMMEWVPEPRAGVFETLITGFDKMFPPAKFAVKRIDTKVVWKNSDTQKSSFLEIPRATGKNLVFAPYMANSPQSLLEFSAYELKSCMKPRFTGTGAAPKDGNEVVEGRNYTPDDFSGGMQEAGSGPMGDGTTKLTDGVVSDLF